MVCRWIFRTRGKFSLKYRSPEAEKKKWQIWRMYTPTANESILRAARKSDEMLEPYEWKRSRTVLRRERASNRPDLADYEDLTNNLGGCFIDLMSGEFIINPVRRTWTRRRPSVSVPAYHSTSVSSRISSEPIKTLPTGKLM